jgi:hypothetical protein
MSSPEPSPGVHRVLLDVDAVPPLSRMLSIHGTGWLIAAAEPALNSLSDAALVRRRLADGAPKGSLLLFGPVHAPAWLWPSWSTSARWELAEPAAENGLNESSTGCSPNGRGGLPALRAPPSEIAAAAAAAAATLGGQKPSNDTDLRRGCPDSFSSIALHSRTEPSFQQFLSKERVLGCESSTDDK